MDIGICVASRIGDVDHAVRTEIADRVLQADCRCNALTTISGLDEILVLPAFAPRRTVIERSGRDLLDGAAA